MKDSNLAFILANMYLAQIASKKFAEFAYAVLFVTGVFLFYFGK